MDELLDDAPCGYLRVADDGHIELANRTFAGMLGRPREELVGRHLDAILAVPGRIFYQTHVFPTLKLQGRVHEVYLSLRDAYGAEIPVLLNATRKARDGRFASEWAVVPMRQRNEYENEILKARKAAEEAGRAKDEFLAMASHELRSPLSAISGWSHLLVRGKLDEEARLRAVRAIQQNAGMLTKLVDDLLDFGRIASGKLRLEVAPVRLDAVVAAAVDGITPAAEAKQISLQSVTDTAGIVVSGDASRLQQVLWNILANAVKFTPRDGRVRVQLRRVGSNAEVTVSDTGRGIAPEFLPFLFEPFRQEGRASGREGGLGLGMAITRNLVELHGGTIAAESAGAGHGSTFTVRLPVLAGIDTAALAGEAAPDAAPMPDAPDLAGADVLVVDDDAETLGWLAETLTRAGAVVRTAASAGEALSRYHERRPDVLLSDIEMAGGDGIALVRRMREIEEGSGARTPAIALTARVQPADRIRTTSAGFHMHLPKPVDALELLIAIANLRGFGHGEVRGPDS